MKKMITVALFLTCFGAFAESVTMAGKITKINPADKEFYINTTDGKKGEFYTTDKTEFTQNGNKIIFADLKKDQEVTVLANKIGKRLDPLKVTVN